MAETRHLGQHKGKDLGGGYTLIFSGLKEKGRRHGVALIVGFKLSPYIQDIILINESMLKCAFFIKNMKYHVYQVYAPQQGCLETEKEEFMELLEETYKLTENETSLLLGDFNGRVGRKREGIENVIGHFGEETVNAEGQRLLEICMRNNLKIMN